MNRMLRIIILNLSLIVSFNVLATDTDTWVIRGNQSQLKAHGISVSKFNHGFGLIDESNFNKINNLESHIKHHWQIIPLKDFKPIKRSTATEGAADSNVLDVLSHLDMDRWLNDVTTLTAWNRVTGSPDNNHAKDWIANKMTALGLTVTTPEFFVNNLATHNIMGKQLGSLRPNDWYLVGAHMDSIPSSGNAPGAVDNASGCAAVLEMARVASLYEFEASLLFICYSGEEQGLHGSYHHVNSLNQTEREQIKAALTLDMIGYTDTGTHKLLLETSNAQQTTMQYLQQMAATYAPELTVFTSLNPFGSDHMPYINNDMPGILSIDDDWDQYDDYHRSSDLPENLNNNQALYIIKTNMAALSSLATLIHSDVIFAHDFEDNL